MKESFLRQVLLIAGKDLNIFVRDRGALVFSLIFPFAFVLLFNMVMGNSLAAEDKPFTVYVATAEAKGSLSDMIIEGLRQSPSLDVQRLDPNQAAQNLLEEKIEGYLFFPTGFTSAQESGRPADITVYVNPEGQTTRAALLSLAEAIAAEFRSYAVTARAVTDLAGGVFPPEAWQVIFGGAAGGSGSGSASDAQGLPSGAPGLASTTPPFGSPTPEAAITVEKVGEIDPPRAVDLLIPGYLVMFVFFGLALTGETLVAERESSTLERLMAGSATRESILGGKILGSFVRGLIQVAIFWVAGLGLFHVRLGHHPLTVIFVSVLVALASSGVGVFVATLAKTRKAAASIAVFASLSFAAFGGSWWPLFLMPQWLQNLAKITPHAWANSAFNKLMLFGASPANVVPEMVALGAFALLSLGLAVWRFRID